MSTLKEDINKVIESLKEAEDFTITQVGDPDPETGAVTSVVKYMPNFFSQEFNDNTLVEINMNHTGLFNFYNNFIIYNVSKLYTKKFFKNIDVIDK